MKRRDQKTALQLDMERARPAMAKPLDPEIAHFHAYARNFFSGTETDLGPSGNTQHAIDVATDYLHRSLTVRAERQPGGVILLEGQSHYTVRVRSCALPGCLAAAALRRLEEDR